MVIKALNACRKGDGDGIGFAGRPQGCLYARRLRLRRSASDPARDFTRSTS